jgi:hypothetical protein
MSESDQQSGHRLSSASAEGERRPGFRAVGVAVSRLAAPIVAKKGGGVLARLKSEWGAIIGPEWSELCWPTALDRDGVLKLRAASHAALDLQHRAPVLIERINGFFGRAAVSRLALVQGPLPLPRPPDGRRPILLDAGRERGLAEQLEEIADPELRAALARLGRAVIGAG